MAEKVVPFLDVHHSREKRQIAYGDGEPCRFLPVTDPNLNPSSNLGDWMNEDL